MTDYDSPWKEAMECYLEAFIAFFFPEVHAEVDWMRGYVFLNKELTRAVRDAEPGKRIADKLVRVYLPEGKETWPLIHIEIQCYTDARFEQRMYVYNYHNQDGVLADPNSLSNPEDKPPLLDDCAYFAERQRVADLHLGKLVLYFSHGTQVTWNKQSKCWEVGQRGFGYSSGGCRFVALCSGLAGEGFAVHEIGHYLHLGHTHRAEPKTINEAAQLIRDAVEPTNGVAADNALTIFDGDEEVVWDTPRSRTINL